LSEFLDFYDKMLQNVNDENFETGMLKLTDAAATCTRDEYKRLITKVSELEQANAALEQASADLNATHEAELAIREASSTSQKALAEQLEAEQQKQALVTQQMAEKDAQLLQLQQQRQNLQQAHEVAQQEANGRIQMLQDQLQAGAGYERHAAALEETINTMKAEMITTKSKLHEYEKAAQEVQTAHQALQMKYEQGQTELAAAQQQAEAATTQAWLATAEAKTAGAEPAESNVPCADPPQEDNKWEIDELRGVVATIREAIREAIAKFSGPSSLDTAEFPSIDSPGSQTPMQQVIHDCRQAETMLKTLAYLWQIQLEEKQKDADAEALSAGAADYELQPSTAQLDISGHCMEGGGHCLVGLTICCQRFKSFLMEDLPVCVAQMQGREPPPRRDTSAYSEVPRVDDTVESEDMAL